MGRLEKEKKNQQKFNASYSTISNQKALNGKTRIGVCCMIKCNDTFVPYKLITERESYDRIAKNIVGDRDKILTDIGAAFCILREIEGGRPLQDDVTLADINQHLSICLIGFCSLIGKEYNISSTYENNEEMGFSISVEINLINHLGAFEINEMADHITAPFDVWDRVTTKYCEKVSKDKNLNKSTSYAFNAN